MQNTAAMKHNCYDFTLYSWQTAEDLACFFNAKTFFFRGNLLRTATTWNLAGWVRFAF